MKDDTVVALRQPESFSDDPLTEILRAGARQLLGQAIEAEVAAHIEAHADLTDASGRRRIVRHGHMPEREVQTGIGAVTVKRPRVRDRHPQATGGRIRFTSSILPPYLRRAKSVEALLPWLYLKGISSGDFSEALAALLGPDAPGLTASTIGRLKAVWWDEYEAWQKRDLSARRYVYFWGIIYESDQTRLTAAAAVIIFPLLNGGDHGSQCTRKTLPHRPFSGRGYTDVPRRCHRRSLVHRAALAQRSALPELWLGERSIRRGAQNDVAPLPGLPEMVFG